MLTKFQSKYISNDAKGCYQHDDMFFSVTLTENKNPTQINQIRYQLITQSTDSVWNFYS